ncbi:MAG TPA: zf-HC2 domain-containing protein [Steroidobacteraceae bacterium]|nr:zf-HC2 domain-containing protein [Steroidobacteraceae bacterium]
MSASPAFTHEESWMLLPWLANGRLGGAERALLEQHLRGCAECAREVELQRLWCSTLTEPERVTYAPGPSFRKLMERIDAEPPLRAGPAGIPLVRAVRARTAWRPPGLAWAASFVLCVGLGTFALTAYRWSQPLYVTTTAPAAAAPGVLHIAFERSLTMGEAERLLISAGARVVEGPDASGVFGIAPVAAAAAPGEGASELRSLADRLRRDSHVRWIEPLAGSEQSDRAPAPLPRRP